MTLSDWLLLATHREGSPNRTPNGLVSRSDSGRGRGRTSTLRQVQRAETWQEREVHLSNAYEKVACMTDPNVLGKRNSVATEVSQFHNRPFQVINGGSIAHAVFGQMQTEEFSDSIDAKMKHVIQ